MDDAYDQQPLLNDEGSIQSNVTVDAPLRYDKL